MPAEVKRALRRRLKAMRDNMDPAHHARASAQIVEHLRALPLFRQPQGILACFPYHNEVDIVPFLDNPPEGSRVFIPHADFPTRELRIAPYPCELGVPELGLREPAPDVPTLAPEEIPARLTVVVMPGVAFSRRTRHRLGYGGGFFDRFLATYPLRSVGIGFDFQMLPNLPYDDLDRPLDMLVSEEGIVGT